MTVPPDRKARIWRQVVSGAMTVSVPGVGVITAEQGAWLEEAAFRFVLRADDRRRLGPTFADSLLAKRIGFMPEPGQIVIGADVKATPATVPVPPAAAPPSPPRDGAVPPDTVRGVRGVDHHGPDEGLFVVLAVDDSEFPDAAIAECVRFLQREPGLDMAVPLHNIGRPICAPLARDESRSGALRLPGGRSVQTIARALLGVPVAHTDAVPDEVMCAVARASAIAELDDGGMPRERAATCLTAFAWARPGTPPVHRWPTQAPERPTHTLIQPAREAVARSRNPGVPVLFVCAGVGPVGGTQVILNLVDALNDRGDISASFAHLFQGSLPHNFRSRTAPVPLSQGEMLRDIEERIGWPRGERAIVVATSFGSGALAKGICERRPNWTPVAFWQDREDLFERRDGKAVRPSEFTEFLGIPRAVSVSRWVAESAAIELDVHADWTVINPAVDPDFHRPRPPRKDGPVRVLSMWRPMTAVRRGLPLLRATYDALRKKYKGRVSLELFGWPEDAPAYATHHGHLDTRQVSALMREVDVVMEPSAFQGFGLSGMEAMASGACFVSTQCRGVDEYATHERNALVVPHDELTQAMCRVIDDEALRGRLAASGAASVMTWDWDAAAARWAHLLKAWAKTPLILGADPPRPT